MPRKDQDRDLQTKEHQTFTNEPPEAKREAWSGFSLTAFGRNQPYYHLILDV